MKYVIISLQSGRVESVGPLLLIKANPILEPKVSETRPLPDTMHKESPNTQNFAYKISVELIDAFISALEDSKADKKFWEPNLNDYVLEEITDFDGNKVLAYEHHSLRLNQVPKPQEILPSFFKPVVIPKKKSHTIEKKEIRCINDYIKSGSNSFDYMLREYDNSQKVYAYPVLVSENFSTVIDRCRLSQFRTEGLYLTNDVIQPEMDSPQYLKHSLLCSAYNRYFTSYSTREELRIYYRFFNKEACHLLFNLFNEFAHPIPFDANKFVNDYENGNKLGLSESLYAECKAKQILEEDIIGFVCCEVQSFDNSTESILYVLTYDPIDNTRSTRFDLYDYKYQKVFIESKYLKSCCSKLMTWAFVYNIQKKAGIYGAELAINDADKTRQLLDYIANNYESMSDNEKDMCAYIAPDTYKLSSRDNVHQEWLHNYVVNLGTLVRTNGLVLGATISFFEESVPKQVDKVIEVIDKRKKFFLDPKLNYKIDAALILIIINLGVQGSLKNITGLWAFYHLIKIREKDCSPLVLEMILLVYKNNQRLFMDLINRVKDKTLIETRDVKGWFRTKTVEEKYNWALYDDMYCYFELFLEYSNNGKGYQLNEFETNFFCQRFISELELDCIDRYFNNSPSINHTTMNIQQQRNFYKKELEKYISERIENKDFLFKDITM